MRVKQECRWKSWKLWSWNAPAFPHFNLCGWNGDPKGHKIKGYCQISPFVLSSPDFPQLVGGGDDCFFIWWEVITFIFPVDVISRSFQQQQCPWQREEEPAATTELEWVWCRMPAAKAQEQSVTDASAKPPESSVAAQPVAGPQS